MNMWLLHSAILAEMRGAQDRGATFSPELVAAHTALLTAGPGSSRLLNVAGDIAEIKVQGVLTDRPSFMAFFMGGGNTTYGELRAALAEADADPEVSEIIMSVDSPGGTVAGLFDTLAAMRATSKPIEARVGGMAASAAFALVSEADKVVATNPAATFGSVGIARTIFVDDGEKTITSTNAPNKVPDVTTEEGVAVVRAELDDVHEIFVEAIAAGRGTTAEKVNGDFGKGGVFLAKEALNRGMIDAITGAENTNTSTASAIVGGKNTEANSMNEQELLAKHPQLYAAVLGKGVTQERDRVNAHLIMGNATDSMDVAIAAVKDGEEMTATLNATYVAAGMNRAAVTTREEEDAGGDPGSVSSEQDGAAVAKDGLNKILALASKGANLSTTVEV